MKDFRKELDTTLSKEQLARLKEMDERRQEMIRQKRKNHENDTLNFRSDRRHNPNERPSFSDGPPPPPSRDHDTTQLPDNK